MGKTSFAAARFSGFMFDPDELVVIGVDTDDGPEHPLWDERIKLDLDEGMILSFMAIGIKEPIIVVKMKIGKEERPVVVDGRRRVLHAREANKRLKKLGETLVKVPAKLEKGSEEHLAHVSVALNEVRRQDDLLIKAAKAKRMLDRGETAANVAVAFGVTASTISSWMKIEELPAPVKKAVNQGVLSANAASKLHGLERGEQLKKLGELKAAHQQTGKRATSSQTNTSAKKKPSVKELREVVGQLSYTPDAFMAGVSAGIRYALGEEVPEVQAALSAPKNNTN